MSLSATPRPNAMLALSDSTPPRWRHWPAACCRLLALALLLLTTPATWATTGKMELVLQFMVSTGLQRSAWVDIIRRFERENPDIEVTSKEMPQEQYKRGFETMIERDGIDVAFWFAGERTQALIRRKLLRPLPAETERTLRQMLKKSALDGTAAGDKLYGMPISYYPWGIFYRKSLFARLKLKVPQTHEELMSVSDQLVAAGVKPFGLGAAAGWPAAAWFDYLNLRLNGKAFHQSLLSGEVPFSDKRVRAVLTEWRELLARGYFHEESLALDWDGVFPFFYRDQVAMMLMGGFAAAKVPQKMKDDLGFVPFPIYNRKVPVAEDAPLDVLVLPTHGRNPVAANRFISFLATSGFLDGYNESISQISPLAKAAPSKDPFMIASRAILDRAEGLTFFYDRDARQELIAPSFEAMREFVQPPHDIDAFIRAVSAQGAGAPR